MIRLHDPRSRRAALGLLSALATSGRARAHEGHAPGATTPDRAAPPSGAAFSDVTARLRGPLPDIRVTDANRRRRRLLSEVFARRVVAIDFVLTDCSTVCGIVSAAMAGAQDLLGPRLALDAGLVSIALDPIGGTPEALKSYASRFGAGPDWSFVNLPQDPLDDLLRRLGGPVAGGDHAPMVLVLDPVRGEIRRLLGLPSPAQIAATIEAALAARYRT